MEGYVNEWRDGEGKNRWRYQVGSDEKIIEIELTQGKVALIDAERLPDVMPYRWSTRKSYREVFYAKTTAGGRTFDMHLHLFPDIVAPRDHIDRNGLNNTRANLRSGAGGINRRNCRTDRQDIGVREYEASYRAEWHDSVGKLHCRTFTWSQFDTQNDAYRAAVACREENNALAIAEILAAQQEGRDVRSTAPPARPKTGCGHKNVCILRRDGQFYRVKADIRMTDKRVTKYFSAFQYGDEEKALTAANEWLQTMREKRILKRDRDDAEKDDV